MEGILDLIMQMAFADIEQDTCGRMARSIQGLGARKLFWGPFFWICLEAVFGSMLEVRFRKEDV